MQHSQYASTFTNRVGYTPVDLSPKWQSGVVSKVKSVRAAALSGMQTFSDSGYELPKAKGVIEILGNREGSIHTSLIIGFADGDELPLPRFFLYESQALGTLSLPTSHFALFLQLAQQPGAHFRIGGTGEFNGLATEPSLFQQLT